MIAVADLLNRPQIPGNHFAFDAYVEGDFELGLITNRHGSRLLALPDTLLAAIQTSLAYEVGDASRLVLFQCGSWWGKNFYRRFNEEVSQYYGKPLSQLEMVEFLQCLKECWKTYGWGLLEIDVSYYNQGFLVAVTRNSGFAATRPGADSPSDKPVCYTEAGLFSAFFSQLTGQDLHCVQTTCESMGADRNHFVLGKLERVKPAEAWLEENHDHATIMERLCHGQALPAPVASAGAQTAPPSRNQPAQAADAAEAIASLEAAIATSPAESPITDPIPAPTPAPADTAPVDLAETEDISPNITVPDSTPVPSDAIGTISELDAMASTADSPHLEPSQAAVAFETAPFEAELPAPLSEPESAEPSPPDLKSVGFDHPPSQRSEPEPLELDPSEPDTSHLDVEASALNLDETFPDVLDLGQEHTHFEDVVPSIETSLPEQKDDNIAIIADPAASVLEEEDSCA